MVFIFEDKDTKLSRIPRNIGYNPSLFISLKNYSAKNYACVPLFFCNFAAK